MRKFSCLFYSQSIFNNELFLNNSFGKTLLQTFTVSGKFGVGKFGKSSVIRLKLQPSKLVLTIINLLADL